MAANLHKSWREGCESFNQGAYWQAHERWEVGWKTLPEPHKTYVQALIQAAGALHLSGRGRTDAACRLARSALAKLLLGTPLGPRIRIEGLEDFLAGFETGLGADALAQLRARLRAELVLTEA